jgi:hypothetical protein
MVRAVGTCGAAEGEVVSAKVRSITPRVAMKFIDEIGQLIAEIDPDTLTEAERKFLLRQMAKARKVTERGLALLRVKQ